MTDLELNEQVARKLGWKWRNYDPLSDDLLMRVPCYTAPNGDIYATVPAYSTSIAAAFGCAESAIASGMRFDLAWLEAWGDEGKPGWSCRFWSPDFRIDVLVRAGTAPRAICEAYLKLP